MHLLIFFCLKKIFVQYLNFPTKHYAILKRNRLVTLGRWKFYVK